MSLRLPEEPNLQICSRQWVPEFIPDRSKADLKTSVIKIRVRPKPVVPYAHPGFTSQTFIFRGVSWKDHGECLGFVTLQLEFCLLICTEIGTSRLEGSTELKPDSKTCIHISTQARQSLAVFLLGGEQQTILQRDRNFGSLSVSFRSCITFWVLSVSSGIVVYSRLLMCRRNAEAYLVPLRLEEHVVQDG